VRELVYAAIRRAGERPDSGRGALLGLAEDDGAVAALFDGSRHGPAAASPTEDRAARGIAPAWLLDRLPAYLDAAERTALLARAPLDLRVNRLKGDVAAARREFPDAVPAPHAPHGLRLAENVRVEESAAYREGRVEVQDAGSQAIVAACVATPGLIVVDLCAGAGGKSLALAADMEGPRTGRLIACDTDRGRLSRLTPRANRAGATVEMRLLNPGREGEALADLAGAANLVLVDAPCSGTGTWRRNPEARWRLTPERLARLTALQAHILALAAPLVRPGGHLVYAVCSLLPEEGRAQVDSFFNGHSAWIAEEMATAAGQADGAGRLLTPLHDGTDGFFVARLRAPC
jgi:16S rRNA (cytosine967-C5)-methyltransferase